MLSIQNLFLFKQFYFLNSKQALKLYNVCIENLVKHKIDCILTKIAVVLVVRVRCE